MLGAPETELTDLPTRHIFLGKGSWPGVVAVRGRRRALAESATDSSSAHRWPHCSSQTSVVSQAHSRDALEVGGIPFQGRA